MPLNKIDNTKFFINSTPSVNSEKSTLQPNQINGDEKKSNSAKYMVGATVLAATVAIGIIGHKNNWWKGTKNITVNKPPEVNTQIVKPQPATPATAHETGTTWQKTKDTLTSPFRKMKERRAAKQRQKEAAQRAEQEAQREKALQWAKEQDDNMRRDYAAACQQIWANAPERKASIERLAQKDIYAERIKKISETDFGDINVKDILPNPEYLRFKETIKTHPEFFVPAPKKGEYDFRHLAVDGYWNTEGLRGAQVQRLYPIREIEYNNQFVLHEASPPYKQMNTKAMSLEDFHNIHWGMQKVIVDRSYYKLDKRMHLGTVLRFSAPEFAVEKSRPLGWNIYIEGDISLEKMREIKDHLIKSGVWARQVAIQSKDTMLEVFSEIIKCLNK